MGEHERRLETLEEKFARLRGEDLSDKEILKVVFEENLDSDIDELVRITGMSKLDIGRIKGSVSRVLKRQQEKKEVEAPPEPPTPYKTELDATAILRDILSKHPDISPKVVEEVCSWAEYGPIHPTQLVYLLQSMRGIQSTTANIVAQKYSLALQKAQQEGRVQIPPPMYSPQPQQPQWGPFPMPFQQSQPQMFPYQMEPLARPSSSVSPVSQPSPFAPQYWQPPQDVRSVVKEEMRSLEERLTSKIAKPEEYVEIQEPLQSPEGEVLLGPDRKPFVRTRKIPVSMAGVEMAGGDPELRFLEKMKHYRDLFGGKEELTSEKVRSIIREEAEARKPAVESVEEHPTVKSMREKLDEYKGALDEYKKDYEKLKDAMADEDRKRMQDTITKLEDRITNLTARGTGEWRTDEMRVISGLLTDIKDILKERKPITEVKDILVPQGVTPARPPSERAGIEERGGVLEELGKKGLAIRVIERLRR